MPSTRASNKRNAPAHADKRQSNDETSTTPEASTLKGSSTVSSSKKRKADDYLTPPPAKRKDSAGSLHAGEPWSFLQSFRVLQNSQARIAHDTTSRQIGRTSQAIRLHLHHLKAGIAPFAYYDVKIAIVQEEFRLKLHDVGISGRAQDFIWKLSERRIKALVKQQIADEFTQKAERNASKGSTSKAKTDAEDLPASAAKSQTAKKSKPTAKAPTTAPSQKVSAATKPAGLKTTISTTKRARSKTISPSTESDQSKTINPSFRIPRDSLQRLPRSTSSSSTSPKTPITPPLGTERPLHPLSTSRVHSRGRSADKELSRGLDVDSLHRSRARLGRMVTFVETQDDEEHLRSRLSRFREIPQPNAAAAPSSESMAREADRHLEAAETLTRLARQQNNIDDADASTRRRRTSTPSPRSHAAHDSQALAPETITIRAAAASRAWEPAAQEDIDAARALLDVMTVDRFTPYSFTALKR